MKLYLTIEKDNKLTCYGDENALKLVIGAVTKEYLCTNISLVEDKKETKE